MTRVRNGVLAVAVVAALVATLALPDGDGRVGASTADYDRLATTDSATLAVDIARQIAGGDLSNLTDLIITTSDQPFDAIVSAGLAGYLDSCPRPDARPCNRAATLVATSDSLPEVTAEAIATTGVTADRITLLGGVDAVSDTVHHQIATTAGWDGTGVNPVVRVAGATRYDTAAAIATHITALAARTAGTPIAASYRTIIVANGDHPADALAASTLAYRSGHLLVLTPGTAPTSALNHAIDTLDANCALIIGGTDAVPSTLDSVIGDALAATGTGACTPERIAGTDRHHTATLIATRLAGQHGVPTGVLLTNSDARPLPLTAAPLTRTNTALLSTRTNRLPATTLDWLTQHPTIARITAVGPETSVSPQAAARALDTTITAPAVGAGGAGGGGGGGFSLSYASTEFLTSSTSQTLAPTVTGGTGPYTYAITNGTLPPGVSFDTTTGTFTGPSTWNLGFVTVSAGRFHTCAILTDTTARCWGSGGDRQLGDGTDARRLHPVAVLASGTQASNPVTLSGITSIAAGVSHTCAVLADTTARCWGLNSDGQIGNGQAVFTWFENPVTVLASGTHTSNPVTLSGVAEISVGIYHTCALMLDTTARCWGANYRGQLGDGTSNNNRPNPVAVLASGTQASSPVTLSGITQISTGYIYSTNNREHTCAVMADTTARCWGNNNKGQVGDGTTTQRLNPVPVLASGTQASSPVTLSGVSQIAVGYEFTCTSMTDTTARCWGEGGYGNLGDGTYTDTANPITVLASGTQASSPVTLSGVAQIAVAYSHACAVLADTMARCWGDGANGKLGDGAGSSRGNPVRVLASGTEAASPVAQTGIAHMSGGEWHTCATLVDGGARCWGYNFNGILGDGTDATTRLNPVRVLASGTEAATPITLSGAITLAPTTITVTVTDSTAATADRVITLTSN